MINSYSVTVLDNCRKVTSDRAKKHLFWRHSTASLSFWGIPPPPWSAIFDEGLIKVSLWQFEQFELPLLLFYHISTCRRALQLLHSCMMLSMKVVSLCSLFISCMVWTDVTHLWIKKLICGLSFYSIPMVYLLSFKWYTVWLMALIE